MRHRRVAERGTGRSEEHTSELQSPCNLVCRLLLGKKKDTSELQSPCNLVCRLLLEKEEQTCEQRSRGYAPAVRPIRSAVPRAGVTAGNAGTSHSALAHRGTSLARAGLAQTAGSAHARPGSADSAALWGRQSTGVRVEARAHAQLLLDLLLDLVGEVGGVEQELAGVLLALPELAALVGVPGAGLAHDRLLDTKVDQPALFANSVTEQNIKFRGFEWGCAVVDDHVLSYQVVQPLHFDVERAAAPGRQDLSDPGEPELICQYVAQEGIVEPIS